MKDIDDSILKTTKEIVVKFIETSRISPSSFHETFKSIYKTVNETVKNHCDKNQGDKNKNINNEIKKV